MIEFTVSGQKKVANLNGVNEYRLYETKVIYPHDYDGITMSEDDIEKRQEALYYVRNFLLLDALGDEAKDPYFRGVRTAEITGVRNMTDKEILKSIEDGVLFDIDIDTLTAADVNKFGTKEILQTVMIMNGDNTSKLIPFIRRLQKAKISEKRVILKNLLGLVDEEVKVLDKKKTKISDRIKQPAKKESKVLDGAKEIA